MSLILLILLILFTLIVFNYITKTPKSNDHIKTNHNDSYDSSFDTATNFINLEHSTNHDSFDGYTDNCSSDNCCDDNCSSDNCCDNNCSDSSCDCGSSDGGY